MRHGWGTSIAVVCTILVVSACAGDGGDSGDTAGADTAGSIATARADSGVMPGADRAPARDANHEFLRGMTDHHQGLILMASAAMSKASRPETQTDAHELHVKQEAEQKQMVSMIQSHYGESYAPAAMPRNVAMNDTLQAKSGIDYDRTFYRNVIAHHREGIAMIDQFTPRLTNPELRQMAEKMKAEQQREIAEFERKLSGLSG